MIFVDRGPFYNIIIGNVQQQLANRLASCLALAGVFVSGTLTWSHITEKTPPCGIATGCRAVANDAWSHIGPIPTALFGLVSYAMLFVLCGLVDLRGMKRHIPLVLSGLGSVTSIALTARAVFVIKAGCPWCLASCAIMLATTALVVSGEQLPEDSAPTIHKPAWPLLAALGIPLALTASVICVTFGSHFDRLGNRVLTRLEVLALRQTSGGSRANGARTKQIIMFTDFECPSCRVEYRRMIPLVERSKDYALYIHHLPIEEHPMGQAMALATEVASEKEKFWEMADQCMKTDGLTPDSLEELAVRLGLSRKHYRQVMADPATEPWKRLERDAKLAKHLRVKGTPTLILIEGTAGRFISPEDAEGLVESSGRN